MGYVNSATTTYINSGAPVHQEVYPNRPSPGKGNSYPTSSPTSNRYPIHQDHCVNEQTQKARWYQDETNQKIIKYAVAAFVFIGLVTATVFTAGAAAAVGGLTLGAIVTKGVLIGTGVGLGVSAVTVGFTATESTSLKGFAQMQTFATVFFVGLGDYYGFAMGLQAAQMVALSAILSGTPVAAVGTAAGAK